jgi:serine/threonine protein kinase
LLKKLVKGDDALNVHELRPGDPERIADFRLLGRIGSGGMGVVYLAVGPDRRHAALKVIRSDLADDPGFRQRFAREVAAASMVRSPVTAAVLAADHTGEKPWVAFEYVDAPNLAEVIATGVPRLSAGLGILSGVAEALVAIHEAGLVHRDLKPANVLVAPSGVVVIDFGIAAALDATTLTRSGVIGTPGWLSPEQVRGERVTFATDSFTWGTLAMYTTTGRHPFGGPDQGAAAYLYRIVHEPPDLDGLPPQLHQLVAAALSQDPAARPTANDLQAALLPGGAPDAQIAPTRVLEVSKTATSLSTDTEVDASPPTGAQTRKGRAWATVVSALVAALVLIGGAVLVANAHGNAKHEPTATTARSSLSASPPPSAPATTSSTTPTTVRASATAPPSTSSHSQTTVTQAPPASPAPAQPTTIPIVDCPTTWGSETPHPSISTAQSATVDFPATIASQLAFYTTQTESVPPVLGPAGWTCAASVGGDGSTGIYIYPAGTPRPAQGQIGQPLVSVSSDSACQGCVFGTVCRFIPSAGNQLGYGNTFTCPAGPPGENVYWLRGSAASSPPFSDAVAFSDPGNPDPLNGVVLYNNPGRQSSASEDDCTLPVSEHALCTAILNNFVTQRWLMSE